MKRTLLILLVMGEALFGVGMGLLIGYSWDVSRLMLRYGTAKEPLDSKYRIRKPETILNISEYSSGISEDGSFENQVLIEPNWDWPASITYTTSGPQSSQSLIDTKLGTPGDVGAPITDGWWLSYRQESIASSGKFDTAIFAIKPHGVAKTVVEYLDTDLDGQFDQKMITNLEAGEKSTEGYTFGKD